MQVADLSIQAPNDGAGLHGTGIHAEQTGPDISFWDFLDIINPLQHIPGVNTLYRQLTGDEISPPAKIIGGGIYGGFIGAALAAVDAVIEDATGKDTGEHVLALFSDEDEAPAAPEVRVAEAPDAPREAASVAPQPVAFTRQPVAANDGPTVDDAGLRWFPIRRDGEPKSFPVSPRGHGKLVREPSETPAADAPGAPLSLLPRSEDRHERKPPADAVARALAAQGVDATGHPMVHGLVGVQEIQDRPRQPSPEQAITVPSWFDKAMMKALDTYERTGRLGT